MEDKNIVQPAQNPIDAPPPSPTPQSVTPQVTPAPNVTTGSNYNDDTASGNPSFLKSKTLLILISLLLIIAASGAGYYFLIMSNNETSSVDIPTPTPILTPTPAPFSITLTNPVDSQILTENVVTVKGKTSPNTAVAVFNENDQNSVDSDSSGNFETTITLTEGINTLIIKAFDEKGEETMVKVEVVYNPSP